MIILPPIVFEAAYFMPKMHFFENIGTILTYAIPGTIFNAFVVGGTLSYLKPVTGDDNSTIFGKLI